MSRVIVTNIPKFVAEKQLREHFKNLGEITDCKIVRDQNGNSRKFGFLGFKDINSATLAQKNYDKTYLGVSKIRVEKAKTRDEEQSPKNRTKNTLEKNKKKVDQNKDKFNKYKKIVQQGVKKSWDDLMVPESSNPQVQPPKKPGIELVQTKKQRITQKKQQKVIEKAHAEKREQVVAIKAPKISQKNKKFVSAPLSIDETRLYVTNIPYNITQEQVKTEFAKFGNVKKVKVPLEYDGSAKGYAFITYELPEEALRAFSQTDNKVIFGRIIHVKPAAQDIGEIIKMGKQAEFQQKKNQLYGNQQQEKSSFQKQKKREMRQKLHDTTSWNTLFLNPNTILESMSSKLGLEKSEILMSQDLAAKIALAQAQVVQETKSWMISQGLNVEFLKVDRNLCERSQKVILVKNLNYRTSEAELKQLFSFYGIVKKTLLAPNRAIAIVQYQTKEFAANALEKLQNTKFKNNFLYLQMAPVGMLTQEDLDNQIEKAEKQINDAEELSKVIYIKNLNFQTQQAVLREFLSKVEPPMSTTIIRDKTGKSMGYGFAEFPSTQLALKVIKKLQNQILDGHKLVLSVSKRASQSQRYEKIKQLKEKIAKDEVTSMKLIVKNLAFQATKNDVKQLFKHYGAIKNIKLPKKMNGQHRGFCFVEYDSVQGAALAKQALSSSHLYGRKLVIEYEQGSVK